MFLLEQTNSYDVGSGCGSVGGAVAYDSRDPQLESRYQQNFIYLLHNRTDENQEKEAGNGSSFKCIS